MHCTPLAAPAIIAVATALAACAPEPRTSGPGTSGPTTAAPSTPRDAEKAPPVGARTAPPADAKVPAVVNVPPDVQAEVPRDLLGAWTLLKLDGKSVSIAPDAHNAPSMSIMAHGSLAGGGGVNQWGSKVNVKALTQKRFDASMPFSTMMAGDPDAMKLESAFMKAITNARTYDISDQTLFLFGADGRELLAFRRK